MNCNSEYKKGRILKLYYDLLRDGVKCGIYSKISRLLFRENITAGRWFVARTIKTFLSVGKLYRDKGSGRPNLLSANPNIQSIIDTSVKENDEITAKEIQQILEDCGYTISIATINRIRRNIGWSIRTTRYCQFIRETNQKDYNGLMTISMITFMMSYGQMNHPLSWNSSRNAVIERKILLQNENQNRSTR